MVEYIKFSGFIRKNKNTEKVFGKVIISPKEHYCQYTDHVKKKLCFVKDGLVTNNKKFIFTLMCLQLITLRYHVLLITYKSIKIQLIRYTLL